MDSLSVYTPGAPIEVSEIVLLTHWSNVISGEGRSLTLTTTPLNELVLVQGSNGPRNVKLLETLSPSSFIVQPEG